jgi:hypothetical protein
VRILLDEVVSHPLPGRPRVIDTTVEHPVTAEHLLRSAGVSVGLVGYIVRGDSVLSLDDLVEEGEPIALYGIYDGG